MTNVEITVPVAWLPMMGASEAKAGSVTPKKSPLSGPKRGRPMVHSDSSDDEAPPAKKARKDSPAMKAKSKSPAMKPKAAPQKVVADSDSSDDDVPVKPKAAAPAKKSKCPAMKPKAAPKRVIDSDSSDDDVPVKKAAPAKKSKSPAMKPKKVVDSDSSDDEAPVKPKAAPAKKAPIADDSSDDDVPFKPKPVANGNNNNSAASPTSTNTAGSPNYPELPANFKPRTSRVDTSLVSFHHDRLRDNTAGKEATDFLQNRKMLAVKGKDFQKHKQKNKSKLYAPPSGVVTDVRSFKFADSDDE